MNSIGDLSVYWFLKIFLILSLFWCGWGISYRNPQNKYFGLYAVIATVVYSVIEGLRWDRGVDYYNYYTELLGYQFKDDYEPLYKLIIDTFSSLFPYWFSFIIYSAFFIISFLLVLKHYPKYAVWALPLLFIITESAAENLVRQFIGISFFLFGYNAYLNKKYITMLLSFLAVPLIHLSGVFVIAFFAFLVFFDIDNRLSKPWLILGIYILLYFFWDTSFLGKYTQLLGSVSLLSGSQFDGYIENADRWFTTEGSLSYLNGGGVLSTASVVFGFLINIIIIYNGFYLYKKNRQFRIPYWFVYFSIVIRVIGADIELYNRFANWLYYFIPLIVAGVMTSPDMNRWEKRFTCFIVLMTYVYPLVRSIGIMPYSGCSFIWDRI